MIVNMYVDHLMSPSPASAEEVWNATQEHSKLFSDAAARIGLTPAEYKEFRSNLLDGKAVYVKLPRRVDAMSGDRRGSVYAVHNAVMTSTIMGWRVALSDGNVVYVPQVCGNISLLKHAAIAQVPHHQVLAYHKKKNRPAYVQADKLEPVTPVVVTPDVPEAPATVAQVLPSSIAAHGTSPFLFFIPAAVGGILAGTIHGSTAVVPPCSAGSNSSFACAK
jgi:hypothetical protein